MLLPVNLQMKTHSKGIPGSKHLEMCEFNMYIDFMSYGSHLSMK